MRAASLALLATATLLFGSCKGGSGPDPNDPTRRDLLVSFADGFYLPALATLVEEAAALEAATEAHATSLAPADREAAQDAWRAIMVTVQRLELAQVGPAGLTFGVNGGTHGGEERRLPIYSWPMTNPCRVDQETVGAAHADPELLAATDRNARGLDAIEYLLFVEDTTNRCSSIASINADGTWAALEAEVPARRATYAHGAAVLVQREAEALRARWTEAAAEPAFRESFVTAGEGSAVYPTLMHAVSDIYGALLYLDTMVKDMKIGVPAGLDVGCTSASCPELRESPFADASVAHIQVNLEVTGTIFRGPADGTGFDDLLVALGGAEIAGRIDVAIDAAVAEAQALEGSIADLLAADPDALLPLFTAVKTLVDLLKTEALAALDINLASVPMDND